MSAADRSTRSDPSFGASQIVSVDPGFRFDLTAAVLRGFSTSVVDCIEPDGTYLQARANGRAGEIVSVRRIDATRIEVRITGRDAEERDTVAARRAFGIDRRPRHFEAAVQTIPWLAAFAHTARGLRPSRYATLWEACAHAIVFQSISLHAATAALRRTILALSKPVTFGNRVLHPFPKAATVAAASETLLAASGLSRAKAATLVRVAQAVAGGVLDEAALERQSTPGIAAALTALPGIGPWTASVVALRAFGRLDTFPPNDSGIARSVTMAGATSAAFGDALLTLGDERGMLYHYLHLERIVRAGDATL